MNPDEPIVFVVDDDYRVREALSSLIASVGLRVTTHGSAPEFLEAEKLDAPACLVLDLQLPGSSRLELQRELADGAGPPIFFITGHRAIPSSVRAMKVGVVEFLPNLSAIRNCCRRFDAALALRSQGPEGAGGTGRVAEALRAAHSPRKGSPALRGGGAGE
jgi:FixJ family two-component response regulator